MNIYPNPGKEYSIIEFSFSEDTKAHFVLYNTFGQIIIKEPVLLAGNNLQQKRVDVSYLSEGIYFCGFQFEDGKRKVEKLVVSK